jgi:hypothetical protein
MSSKQKVCILPLYYGITSLSLIVESLSKELQVVRRNAVCERCKEARNVPRFTQIKTLATRSSFRPVVQSKSPQKTNPSSRVVNPSRLPATQHTTRKPIASARPLFQTNTHPTPDRIATLSTVDSESSDEHHTWSVTFNDEVEKEFELEVAHELSHDEGVYGVNFSRDGKYLAAGVI